MEPNERNGQPHVAASARSVAEHASALTRLELELALLELKRKAAALGVGAGSAAVAAVLGLFALGFAFATVAAALTTVFDRWLALLITTGILLVLAALLALVAIASFRRATPPVPKQAIEQAKLTGEAIKR